MRHGELIGTLALALMLAACNGDAGDARPPDLGATAEAASAQAGAARRAQTATAQAHAARATLESRQTRAAADAMSASATAEARRTAQAQAAYAFAMTATADALAIAERQAQATATADAMMLTRARAISEATASGANLERAQAAAGQEAQIARRNADFFSVFTPLAAVGLLGLIIWGAWLAYFQTLEARRLRYSILESRAGTVVFVREGRSHSAQLLTPNVLPEAKDYDTTQARIVDAETDSFTVRHAQGVTIMPKTEPRNAEQEAARRLAMRLLRAAMLQAGATANRIPPARELGIPPGVWVKAVALLKPHVTTRQGRAGGTTLEGQYPTLASLYDAVGSRRLTSLLGSGTATLEVT